MTDRLPLSEAQIRRLAAVGDPRDYLEGEELVAPGDRDYPLALIESGEVEVSRAATGERPAVILRRWGAGEFTGEWGLLTGEAALLTIRAVAPARVIEVSRDRLLEVLAGDADLASAVLGELQRRRLTLRANREAASVQILGDARTPAALGLRSWAERQGIVFSWLDVDESEGAALYRALGCTEGDLPIVLTPTATLPHATVGEVSAELGLTYRNSSGVHDMVVVGGGPAGLAAAVYGASEGLSTILLDGVSVGGQAAGSSRIENYLGFPDGISGRELTGRGLVQAQKFGALVSTPCVVRRLWQEDDQLRLALADGTEVGAHVVVIATGAAYKRLPLEGWKELEGAGVYYAATEIEAESCLGRPVVLVGGANSAGQAALFLAGRGSQVHLVVRGRELSARMSSYLVRRIIEDERIDVHCRTEVSALRGERLLVGVTLSDRSTDETTEVECAGLFCFIGARPATDWLAGVALDALGFVRTDSELTDEELPEIWSRLGRRPFAYETSMPGVFAVGDVRCASMKRVAAAVGEGSSAVLSVHRALAIVAERPPEAGEKPLRSVDQRSR